MLALLAAHKVETGVYQLSLSANISLPGGTFGDAAQRLGDLIHQLPSTVRAMGTGGTVVSL